MIKAIIFDNFGVLYVRSAKLAFDELSKGDASLVEQYRGFFVANDRGSITTEEWAEGIADLFGITSEEWVKTLKSYDGRNIRLLEQVKDLRKHYKTALLTNLGAGRISDYFSAEELNEYFDVAFASGDIGLAKPDTAVFEYVADKLEIKTEEAIFIDDSEANTLGAQQAGMNTILFQDNEQFRKALKVLLER